VTSQVLARTIIGKIIPNRGDLNDIPEPYRTTVMQSRALMKTTPVPVVPPSEEDADPNNPPL
jgi:hypothetical protein